MAKTALQLEIEGLKELQKKAIQLVKDMHGPELANAMRDSVLKLQRRTMQGPPGGYGKRKTKGGGKGYVRTQVPVGYIPVDTGRLRASITPIVEARGPVLRGIVGTNVEYGPYQEFGTRRGVRALGFMRAAVEARRQWIYNRFDRAMKLIVKRKPR